MTTLDEPAILAKANEYKAQIQKSLAAPAAQ